VRRTVTLAGLVLSFAVTTLPAHAQFLGSRTPDEFRDLNTLKPPPGSKAAIIVFEDLACPGCAYAHPLEKQAAEETHAALLRYDYPIASHLWTFDGAVCARYLQEKVGPQLAEQYRAAVFASQNLIANKDDLHQFTQRWMQQHGQQMPFVIDPGDTLAAKVRSDYNLGQRIHLTQTPTIIVVTQNNYQVVCGTDTLKDPTRLFPILNAAIAQANSAPKAQLSPRSTHMQQQVLPVRN
jgi:protein-disulfide isomerase